MALPRGSGADGPSERALAPGGLTWECAGAGVPEEVHAMGEVAAWLLWALGQG